MSTTVAPPAELGWLKAYRTLFSPETNRLHPANQRQGEACKAWARMELIGLALWRDEDDLERGQLQVSTTFLSDRWGWSPGKVSSFLGDLEDEDEIERHQPDDRTKPQIIEIVDFDAYQAPNSAQDEIERQTERQPERETERVHSDENPQETKGDEGDGLGSLNARVNGSLNGSLKQDQEVTRTDEEETQTDSGGREGADSPSEPDSTPESDPTPEQPSLLDVPEGGPEPDAIDRTVREWHEAIIEQFREIKGKQSSSRITLSDGRKRKLRELIEAGYSKEKDLIPAVRHVLTSDHWQDKGGSSQYATLFREGKWGPNIEAYRDLYLEDQSDDSPSQNGGDVVDLNEMRAARRERLEQAKRDLGS